MSEIRVSHYWVLIALLPFLEHSAGREMHPNKLHDTNYIRLMVSFIHYEKQSGRCGWQTLRLRVRRCMIKMLRKCQPPSLSNQPGWISDNELQHKGGWEVLTSEKPSGVGVVDGPTVSVYVGGWLRCSENVSLRPSGNDLVGILCR